MKKLGGSQMENTNDYLQQKIKYVKERALAEKRAPQHIKQEYGNKLDLNKFISDIIRLHEEFLNKIETENTLVYSNDDEHKYIAEKTNYSTEMIELVLWFEECYQMKMDCFMYQANCIKCGCDELYIREEEGELFSTYIECGSCGKKYSFDDMDNYENSILPLNNDIVEEAPQKGTITDKSYVFKAATGYRKGIWRKIQISAGATLDELSSAILNAFYFDHDHLYAFYMDEKGRKYNVPAYYSPDCRDEPRADKMILQDFNFTVGTKFLYLYDFGDEWHFTITFDKGIAEATPHPFVVQSRGEAPEQYLSLW